MASFPKSSTSNLLICIVFLRLALLVQGSVTKYAPDSPQIRYSTIIGNGSTASDEWKIGKLGGDTVVAVTEHSSTTATFSFTGTSIQVFANSSHPYLSHGFAEVVISMDGERAVLSPPFVNDVLFNTSVPNSTVQHSIVIKKSEDSSDESILLISSITVIDFEIAKTDRAKGAEVSSKPSTPSNHRLPSDGVIVGVAIGTEVGFLILVCLAIQIYRRFRPSAQGDRRQVVPYIMESSTALPLVVPEESYLATKSSGVPHSGAPPPPAPLKTIEPLHSGGPAPGQKRVFKAGR